MDGDAAHRAALAQQWAEADLVVTGYELLRRTRPCSPAFYACILDEAQAIKNHTTQKYKAVCLVRSGAVCPTGTLGGNRLGAVEHLLLFDAAVLPPHMSFCNRFEKPIPSSRRDKEAARRLNLLTSPFILRRMKSEVLRSCPKTETVLPCGDGGAAAPAVPGGGAGLQGQAPGGKTGGSDGGVCGADPAAGAVLRPPPGDRGLGRWQRPSLEAL